MSKLGKAWIPSKYDIDHVFGLLEPIGVFLFIVFVLLVGLLLGCIWQWGLERLAYNCALEHRVVALGVDWAPFVVEDLINLILRFSCLLATQGAIHGADSIIWLVLTRRIPLVAGASRSLLHFPLSPLLQRGKLMCSCSSSSA